MNAMVMLIVFTFTTTILILSSANKESFLQKEEKTKKEMKEATETIAFSLEIEIARSRYFDIYHVYPVSVQDLIDKKLLPVNFGNSKYSKNLSIVNGSVRLDTTSIGNDKVVAAINANTNKIITRNNLNLTKKASSMISHNNNLAAITKSKDYNNLQVPTTDEIKILFDTTSEQETLLVESTVDTRELNIDSTTIQDIGGW